MMHTLYNMRLQQSSLPGKLGQGPIIPIAVHKSHMGLRYRLGSNFIAYERKAFAVQMKGAFFYI
uniref:Uncharacterized protein n=1 Tax=Rhizophora mucronata TaxID=61149 RepID=A0A2P2QH41_RHIMU